MPVEVLQADITKLEVDAIANAANTDLRHGGGVTWTPAVAWSVSSSPSGAATPSAHSELL